MGDSSADESTSQQQPGLQGLPEELLDAILRQLDASSRMQVFRTSKLLATALLQRFPRIQLTYPTQHDILGQRLCELAPFLTEVLRNRQQPKLHLTLRPGKGLTDATWQQVEAAVAADAPRLVSWMLGAVPLCGAVDCLTISWNYSSHLPWEPVCSAALAASFPSLMSLTFLNVRISIGHLANAINHPLLMPRLLHLDLRGIITTHEDQLGISPFIGGTLQKLRLRAWVEVDGVRAFLPGLVPLPPTLTQLEVCGSFVLDRLAAAVTSLTQLQELRLINGYSHMGALGPGPMALLQALAHLPSLHTLVVECIVKGQQQLDALLALTQITRLELKGFSGLTSSNASAACSWRQLKVKVLDWVTAAYLPLHSLTSPLRLHELVKDVEEPSAEVLAAAELNLCERNKAGLVLDEDLVLSKATVDLLTEQYLSHSRHTAQHLSHPTVPSSSSPGGHIMPGGQGSSIGPALDQQVGSAAGDQALMQRLGHYMKALNIIGFPYTTVQGPGKARLSTANRQALAVLFPTAEIVIGKRW